MAGSSAEPPPAAGGAAVFGAAARPLWLLNPDITYLNHGSFGATPRVVLDAQAEWRRRMEFEPVRFMTQIRDGLLRQAATTLAAFLGASGDDLVFVDNATTGINTILQSLALESGDEVVTTSHVYPAVRLTLEEVCGRRRARLIEAAVPFPAASMPWQRTGRCWTTPTSTESTPSCASCATRPRPMPAEGARKARWSSIMQWISCTLGSVQR